MKASAQVGLFAHTTRHDWETPQWLFDQLHAEFNFTVDVCASLENAKCERYFTREQNGLAQDWTGERCWMNPPYGREIGAWIRKAAEETEQGAAAPTLVVALVPARTDTAWWHDHVLGREVRFLRGRLRFGAVGRTPAPFPSAIVVFATSDRAQASEGQA